MPRRHVHEQRLAGVFLLGCVLFNFPFITLFDRDVMVLGIPLFVVYMFGAWLGIIALMALATRSKTTGRTDHSADCRC